MVKGPSVPKGYFGDEATSQATFRGGRVFTGDLGYFAEGRLYVCGRSKDLIILRGRNYFPQDIEKIISEIEGVRTSQVAVFTCPPRRKRTAKASAHGLPGGDERLVAVAEVSKSQFAKTPCAARSCPPYTSGWGSGRRGALPPPRGAARRTSSGKVRRSETRARLVAGTLQLATGSEE